MGNQMVFKQPEMKVAAYLWLQDLKSWKTLQNIIHFNWYICQVIGLWPFYRLYMEQFHTWQLQWKLHISKYI